MATRRQQAHAPHDRKGVASCACGRRCQSKQTYSGSIATKHHHHHTHTRFKHAVASLHSPRWRLWVCLYVCVCAFVRTPWLRYATRSSPRLLSQAFVAAQQHTQDGKTHTAHKTGKQTNKALKSKKKDDEARRNKKKKACARAQAQDQRGDVWWLNASDAAHRQRI